MLSPLDMSAVALSQLIRRRELSPVEVVGAHIDHIRMVNPRINALVVDRFQKARNEAKKAEQQVMAAKQGDTLPSLLGVPCTIKEFFAVEGMPQTSGLLARSQVTAKKDSVLVRRLRQAGAIVLGVGNAAEGGLWMETRNPVYGTTNNPWNLKHTSGGSSGGEAALVAAGGVPFGLGADVGGSIRIPAAFCGVAGHKPTGRMVPALGHYPEAPLEVRPLLACGPIARWVEDLLPLLRILAGPDGQDTSTRHFELGQSSAVDLKKVVVYPVESQPLRPAQRCMRDAVRRAAKALQARGAQIRSLREVDLGGAFGMWSAMMSASDSASYAEMLGNGKAIPIGRELLQAIARRSNHSSIALLVCAAEKAVKHLPSGGQRLILRAQQLQRQLESAIGPNGVILHPPYTRPAPRHRMAMLTPFDFIYTALFNALEFPGTVVPVTRSANNLPIAVQVLGQRGQDQLTIGVAAELESAFGGYQRAPCQ